MAAYATLPFLPKCWLYTVREHVPCDSMGCAGRQLTGSFPIPLGDIEVPLKVAGSVVMVAKGKKEQQTKQSVELTPVSSSDATQILDSTFGLLQKALV